MIGWGRALNTARRITLVQSMVSERRERRQSMRWKSYRLSQEYKRLSKKEQSILDSIGSQLLKESIPESDRACPECSKKFVLIDVAGEKIDTCLDCGSFWFDEGELKTLTKKDEDVPGEKLAEEESKYNCPVCQEHMKQYHYQIGVDLLVDVCPDNQGVYLEKGELKGVLDMPPEPESEE